MSQLEQFRADFSEVSMGVIARMLSTLYANPARSVLREYIANGIDAHTEAKVSCPVEVTLPTGDVPRLIVRDFGDGLSLDQLKDTFFRYANSSKTDDDDAIGALGIGAKSAFAITAAWTVTNVHKGRKFVLSSVMDGQGTPLQSVIVNGEPTDDRSGITVDIPINAEHMSHGWSSSAESLAYWFPKNSVKFVNLTGEMKHHTDAEQPLDGVVLTERTYSPMEAVMGGIAYAVDTRTSREVVDTVNAMIPNIVEDTLRGEDGDCRDFNVSAATSDSDRPVRGVVSMRARTLRDVLKRLNTAALLVDNGAVDFTDSREGVKGTPRTVKALVSVLRAILVQINADLHAVYMTGDPISHLDEIRRIANIVSSPASPLGVMLACGVPKMDTNIRMDIKNTVDLSTLFLRAINGTATTLVIGRHGKSAIPKASEMSRLKGVGFLYTEGTADVEGFGDVSRLFTGSDTVKGVITYDEYNTLRKASFAPTPRNDSRIEVYFTVRTEEDKIRLRRDMFTIKEFLTWRETNSHKVYLSKNAMSSFSTYAELGMEFAVIIRGRRDQAVLERRLGFELADTSVLYVEREELGVAKAVDMVNAASRDDVRAILARRNCDTSLKRRLETIMESEYAGELSESDLPKFLEDVRDGDRLVTDSYLLVKSVDTILGSLSKTRHRLVNEGVREEFGAPRNPWPLLASYGVDLENNRSMQHAVAYIKATSRY